MKSVQVVIKKFKITDSSNDYLISNYIVFPLNINKKEKSLFLQLKSSSMTDKSIKKYCNNLNSLFYYQLDIIIAYTSFVLIMLNATKKSIHPVYEIALSLLKIEQAKLVTQIETATCPIEKSRLSLSLGWTKQENHIAFQNNERNSN